MAENQPQQVSTVSIASGQEALASLQPQQQGLVAVVNAMGLTLLNAEHNSPWVATAIYFFTVPPNGSTIVPIQQLIQSARQRRPETEYAGTAR